MRNAIVFSVMVMLVLGLTGCKKQPPAEDTQPAPADQTTEPADAQQAAPAEDGAQPAEEPAADQQQAAQAADDEKLVPLPLELPKPLFVGTPANLSGIENLEPDTKQERPEFLAPEGVKNLALNKPVISSEMDPFTGSLDMIVDGDKEATEGSVVELGPFKQWVQIDLQDEYELYAILFWHYHASPRVYHDVVVQVSSDPEFITDVTTLFNNDIDNSLGLGVGQDMHYIDKSEGKLVDAKGTEARYVRLYSQGNNQNDYTHYIEVEVYGK